MDMSCVLNDIYLYLYILRYINPTIFQHNIHSAANSEIAETERWPHLSGCSPSSPCPSPSPTSHYEIKFYHPFSSILSTSSAGTVCDKNDGLT